MVVNYDELVRRLRSAWMLLSINEKHYVPMLDLTKEAAAAIESLQRDANLLREVQDEIHKVLQDETITHDQRLARIFGLVVPFLPPTDDDMEWAKREIERLKK